MSGDDLPYEAHVVHYARPTTVREDGRVDGSAFRLRAGDTGLSVNWLEYFAWLTRSQQLNEVRRLSRIEMRQNGRLAELDVGATKLYVRPALVLRNCTWVSFTQQASSSLPSGSSIRLYRRKVRMRPTHPTVR